MNYSIKTFSNHGHVTVNDNIIKFKADNDFKEAFFGMKFDLEDYEDDAFILMPACAYNGNRFKRAGRYGYPIIYTDEEMGIESEPIIPEVPALNKDGSGEIEVTSGDMAVPCVGVFYKNAKKGMFIYTEQCIKGKNIGFTVRKGIIELSYPANRKKAYRWSKPFADNIDTGLEVEKGEEITSEFKIFTFDCDSINAFFEQFFNTRKSLMSDERTPNMYTKDLWNVMEKHFNNHLWSGEYYGNIKNKWAVGWTGCGMSSYPLMLHGNEITVKRAEQTIDFMVCHQSQQGFFYNYNFENKINVDDSFCDVDIFPDKDELNKGIHFIRRSGDVLGYLIKHIEVNPKPTWVESAKKCADGLSKVFEKYGTFGQYVHIETGELLVGTSCAGASAIGSLVNAYTYFNCDRYIETAIEAGEFYYKQFISQGITSGAIADAVCSPDSESAAAFIESYVLLYEITKDEKWLGYAKAAAHILSSWVVTYRYKFPADSEFYRLNVNTVGSVFANIQNKHATPGLATTSGEYIYKLYKYIDDKRYLELILDIASAIPQSISTDERPIYAKMSSRDGVPLNKAQKLCEGYISERVNLSDWEGFAGIGNVFNSSCWCETTAILTFSDLIYKHNLDW